MELTLPYSATTERRESGYRADQSIADNMVNPTIRQTFKQVVEEQFSKAFTEIHDLKAELARV